MSKSPRVLVIGAHPDDADIKTGGTSAQWVEAGGEVLFVSVADGGAGHQTLRRPELVERRRREAEASGAVIGVRYLVMDIHDGEVMPTLEAREKIIRLIREFRPDLVVTHRPTDYHPDHRYTAQLVQDAAYLITVPALCPDVRHLDRNPVIAYFSDAFKKPYPFEPHVVIDIGAKVPKVVDMLDRHVSQFYEWLPYNSGILDQVPADAAGRRAWLDGRYRARIRPLAERYRQQLCRTYGDERGMDIEYVEAFEVSELGAPLDPAGRARLFPFLPPLPASASRAASEWVDIRDDE
jgi:LmbE family N-acetylglucosaminyl deacetylase